MNETCFTIALLLTMGEHDHMWWGAVYNIFLRKAWASAFMLVQCQHELFSDVWRDSNLALLCKPQHPEDCWERTGVSQQTLLSFFRAHLTHRGSQQAVRRASINTGTQHADPCLVV